MTAVTVVYYNHDGGDLNYEQFETEEEAVEWAQSNEYKAIFVEGAAHRISDHT